MTTTIEELFTQAKGMEAGVFKEAFLKIKERNLSYWKNDKEMRELVVKDYEGSLRVLSDIFHNDMAFAIKRFVNLDTAVRETFSDVLKNVMEENKKS